MARLSLPNSNSANVSTSATTKKVVTASTIAELHDRYLAPALKIPKKLAHLMPAETQRAMEVKILNLMIGLYWLSYPSSATPFEMPIADRCTCIRYAKTRLRQFWTHYLHGALTASTVAIPLPMWQECAEMTSKMVAADLFLLANHASDTSSDTANAVDEHVQYIERAFTAIADWRPWLKMAENGRVVQMAPLQSAATDTNKGGGANQKKGGGSKVTAASAPTSTIAQPASSAILLDASLGIAKHLTQTLMALLKLMKATNASASTISITESVKKALALSTSESLLLGGTEAARAKWFKQFGACIDDAGKEFNGRRSKR